MIINADITDNMMSSHAAIMADLAKQHHALLPIIGAKRIHYLDIPFHDNLGDLLIMLGTLQFFKTHHIKIDKIATYFNYSPAWAKQDDVIVMHGGGNFGDIYGPFQAFRERIISALPNNRIILLPQSIHFNHPENLKRCRDLFLKHADLHICVRDQESALIAKEMTPNVYLLPDMAHQLWPVQRTQQPVACMLKLFRRDAEAQKLDVNKTQSVDWQDLTGSFWTFFLPHIAERGVSLLHRLGLNQIFVNWQAKQWIWQANRFKNKAVNLFSQHQAVHSDRLHAHILSCLMSMPNQVSDNSYGKNKRYVSIWTKHSPLVNVLNDHSELSKPEKQS